jgi:hypothetical protein
MSDVTQPAAAPVTPQAAAGDPSAIFQPAAPAAAQPAKAEAAPAAPASTPAEPPKESKETKTEAKEVKEETKPASEQKPVAPEKYDLKLPKDSPVSAARLEKIASYAKERGLSNDEAQALVDRESEAVSQYASSVKDSMKEKQGAWVEEAKADKEIGGDAFKQNVETAKRVVQRYGTDSLKNELSSTGLGNHPELVRLLVRIGKSMSEDQLVIPGQKPSGKKSAESILYGDSKE